MDLTNKVEQYPSIAKAGDMLNINKSHICECCKGKQKRAGRFRWGYA